MVVDTMGVNEQYRDYVMIGFVKRVEPVIADHGDGALLYDADGTEYVDCFAGISVTNDGRVFGFRFRVKSRTGGGSAVRRRMRVRYVRAGHERRRSMHHDVSAGRSQAAPPHHEVMPV